MTHVKKYLTTMAAVIFIAVTILGLTSPSEADEGEGQFTDIDDIPVTTTPDIDDVEVKVNEEEGEPEHAQEIDGDYDQLVIEVSEVLFGEPNLVVEVDRIQTDTLTDYICNVSFESSNNHSVHPNSAIRIVSNDQVATIEGIEDKAGLDDTKQSTPIMLGNETAIEVVLGDDGVFSASGTVTLTCTSPPAPKPEPTPEPEPETSVPATQPEPKPAPEPTTPEEPTPEPEPETSVPATQPEPKPKPAPKPAPKMSAPSHVKVCLPGHETPISMLESAATAKGLSATTQTRCELAFTGSTTDKIIAAGMLLGIVGIVFMILAIGLKKEKHIPFIGKKLN